MKEGGLEALTNDLQTLNIKHNKEKQELFKKYKYKGANTRYIDGNSNRAGGRQDNNRRNRRDGTSKEVKKEYEYVNGNVLVTKDTVELLTSGKTEKKGQTATIINFLPSYVSVKVPTGTITTRKSHNLRRIEKGTR